jgi:hypothetical protein
LCCLKVSMSTPWLSKPPLAGLSHLLSLMCGQAVSAKKSPIGN